MATAPLNHAPGGSGLHLFRALRSRNYRLFFLGQGISLVGTFLTQIATIWLVYHLTSDERWLGAVAFAGQVPLFFPTIPGAMPFINSGRVRALAVSSTKRSAALPQVPTMQEAGVRGYEASAWYPVLVPSGTPRPIVEQLNARFVGVVKGPEVRKQLTDDGVEPIGSTPAELAAYMASELKKWAQVVKAAGIEAQ
jgi:tripartite-type tricarboxylate transporter receptor subunit TctC